MASRFSRRPSTLAPEPIEISDSDELYSMSEEEPTQQELNNRRLAQAVNYLRTEGGEDSPATFISRVNRIDEALVQSLSTQGRNFDPELHRKVRALVRKIQHDYEAAADEDSMQIDSEDDFPDNNNPAEVEEALYRDDSPSPSPTPVSAPKSKVLAPRRPGEDNVEREREFKYGGPHNEVEAWHKNFPDSLPFPETHMMAHWESLKIDYDLSRSNDENFVETDVPFNHPRLLPYFHLPQYESGTRFRHPFINEDVARKVARYGTEEQLKKVVDAFNRGDDLNTGKKDFAPRVFLEKFSVGKQLSPNITTNDIRHSVNITPTRARTPSASGPSTVPSNFIRSSPVARRISTTVRTSINADTPSTTPQALRRVATSVVIPARPRGRPRKNPLPVAPPTAPEAFDASSDLGASPEEFWTNFRSAIKKNAKAAGKDKTGKKGKVVGKKVGFADVEAEKDGDVVAKKGRGGKAKVSKVAGKAKVSKATAAGKRVKKSSVAKSDGATARAGTTRSGAKYLR